MLDAARAKARRASCASACRSAILASRIRPGLRPDLRMQEAIRLIFARFRELGSARQVFCRCSRSRSLPRPSDGKKLTSFDWTPIRYRNVISVLKNPFYAGAYAYGKGEKRTEIVDGRPGRATAGKPLEEWEVLLKDHHDGYIDWAEFERNQKQLAVNACKLGGAKSGRGGRVGWAAFLWALRRRLVVSYSGAHRDSPSTAVIAPT